MHINWTVLLYLLRTFYSTCEERVRKVPKMHANSKPLLGISRKRDKDKLYMNESASLSVFAGVQEVFFFKKVYTGNGQYLQ